MIETIYKPQAYCWQENGRSEVVMCCKAGYFRKVIFLLFPVFLVFGVVGCAYIGWPKVSWRRPEQSGLKRFEVVPISNRDVADLDSDDIVQIMRRAGFSDEQILALGTDLRNAILLMGAAQIRKEKIEAIFAVRGDYIFITTRLRGNFIYNPKSNEFGMTPAAPPASTDDSQRLKGLY